MILLTAATFTGAILCEITNIPAWSACCYGFPAVIGYALLLEIMLRHVFIEFHFSTVILVCIKQLFSKPSRYIFFFLLSLFDFSGIECVPTILLVQNLWRLATLGRRYCNIATAWSWTNARIQESVSMPLWIWDTLFTQGEIQWWHSCQLHLRSYLCPLWQVGSIDI